MNSILLVTVLLLFSSFGWSGEEPLYSVAKVISSLNEKQREHHRALKIKPPETLYHWISVNSALKLLKADPADQFFPLKTLGDDLTQPQFTFKVPAFYKKRGLFAWHNPVGATIGGSGEIYGNNEALLALKIDSRARVGLIVTLDNFETGSEKLLDPIILGKYDLILHASGLFFDSQFSHSLIEWVIVNPEIISEFTLDPRLITKELDLFEKILQTKSSDTSQPLIETIAGPQHTGMGAYAINSARVRELKASIKSNHTHLQKLPSSQGWQTRKNSCLKVVESRIAK